MPHKPSHYAFPSPFLRRLILGVALWLTIQAPVRSQEPTAQGPLEPLCAGRDRIVLNGLWKSLPATGPSADTPAGDWGTMWVPGSWFGGFAHNGSGPEWATLGNDLQKVWYEREIQVPAAWKGRRVVIDFRRVSTDARVWVNGTECGGVEWPFGTVDITRAVAPGATAQLRVLVTATTAAGERDVMMGTNANQLIKVQNKLASAGLIGEVFLLSEPLGPMVSDVFVEPSVRKKQLTLDLEITGMTRDETVAVTATMVNAAGQNEQVFQKSLPLRAMPVQRAGLSFPWANPAMWSPEHPNLYTLHLKVAGSAIQDTYPQRFGFREFWVEGRQFFLNGQPIRLRPNSMSGGEPTTQAGIDAFIDGMRNAGFNIIEHWPSDQGVRGTSSQNREFWSERADEKGMLAIGDALDFGDYLARNKRVTWFDPGVKESYRARLDAEMRHYRNSPSIVMWATIPNRYGQLQDQNPRTIGIRGIDFPLPPWALQDVHFQAGLDGLNVIRSVDPTRPVFSHSGDMVGDIYTINNYLNFTPLQEREEWLSNYAEKGDMPYMAVEFGLPLDVSLQRGRNGYTNAVFTEPLATEFCATYLGPDAYRLESPDYRSEIASKYQGGQKWSTYHNNEALDHEPAFDQLQALFIRNTWRSWRAAGDTGGMVPWNFARQVFAKSPNTPLVDSPPFQPGLRGAYKAQEDSALLHYLDPKDGWKTPLPAQALLEVNGPTLAWIAGSPENFYEKAHSFHPGQKVTKQVCLINDLPAEATYHVTWRITVAGQSVHEQTADGKIGVASNVFLPLPFTVPTGINGEKADGEIEMEASIGGRASSDRFAFRVVAPKATALPKMLVFDPAGKTGALLKSLGADAVPWTGGAATGERPLLVVGRQALSNGTPPPGDLEKFVAEGGRLLVMSQDPEWMRKVPGFRISRQVSRRFFPVMNDHPITAGLDAEDLRDWAGAGTLVDARPVYPLTAHTDYGWHWGNQGSVSSSAVEKPHFSGWTPILEGEFDMAYSPLMQLDYGKGVALLCTLDLEDQSALDPVAEVLARRILAQAVALKAQERRKTVFLGGDADAALLKSMGVTFERNPALPQADALAVIGPDASVTADQLNAFASRGGNVLILASAAGRNLQGEPVAMHPGFFGTTAFQSSFGSPLAGLSVSDLHFRAGVAWPLFGQSNAVAAEGLLSSRSVGQGKIVAAQLDPVRLDADHVAYFRFTRWRQMRALSQLLANLGASFAADGNLFNPRSKAILYYPDYNPHVSDGDDPARYYRW